MKHFLLLLIILSGAVAEALGCTSAIIGPKASASGRPLLWKHRDTSAIDNKIEYIPAKDGAYGYVALFNADDRDLEQAWMGMNDAGFAIMNTASYNIKNDKVPNSEMDREGYVMTIALRSCRTIGDFEKLLEQLPRPMGVEANFGVIDATGNGAFFETNNDSFVRFDLSDAEDNVLVRTNYSHAGRKGQGLGYVREDDAKCLLRPYVESRSVTPEVLTEKLSRSFYNDLKGRDYATAGERYVVDQDFIPRYKSTATIVIEGMLPVEDASTVTPRTVAEEYIMWTGMGYPPCSEILPVWCRDGGVDDSLRGLGENGRCAMGDKVKARRDDVFSHSKGKTKYVDMTKLYNPEGTGYIQVLVPQNKQVYETITRQRDSKHKAEYGNAIEK
ncbi:MAG: hypothetical protein MR333_07505 [Porphyromonadaceae bacterium]|nr:hypothetical protein [Porphyromonadaceae bacterium]